MASGLSFTLLAIFGLHVANAKIPDYIHVCKRNEPKLEECIINSIEALRPQLAKGMPEYDVPALEPIRIEKIDVSNGAALKAVGTDVLIRGASKFQIKDLKADINNIVYQVTIFIPFLSIEANYDVNAKLLNLNLKGKGPLKANTTDIDGKAILKGHKVKKDGKTYVLFDSLDLKLNLKNYIVHFENLFNGDKALNDAINTAINENKKELINLLRPQAEKIVSSVLLDRANKITKHFTFEELFP